MKATLTETSSFTNGFQVGLATHQQLLYQHHAFLTNSDFKFIALPSILQPILWSPSCRRMPFTLVPCLMTMELPLTLRSLIRTTVSPSCNTAPLASLTLRVSSAASPSFSVHSNAHSGQMYWLPSS